MYGDQIKKPRGRQGEEALLRYTIPAHRLGTGQGLTVTATQGTSQGASPRKEHYLSHSDAFIQSREVGQSDPLAFLSPNA